MSRRCSDVLQLASVHEDIAMESDGDAGCGRPTSAEAVLRRSGGVSFRVRLFELSRNGCKIELIERPAVGERVWLKFETIELIPAIVRWIAGHVGGLEFEHPISEGVFEKLAQ